MTARHPFTAIKFHTVIYLGAGAGGSLNDLIAQIRAEHWHLVEGDSKKHQSLQQTIDALQNRDKIQLHKCIVSDDGTQKTWFNYNLDEFSGLKKAKNLSELFPGIKLKHQQAVDTEALPHFLNQLELNSKENHLLIIDLPGQVLELIEAILKAGQKPLFSQLVLTATKEQLFEQGGNLERIKQWLDKQGYHTRNEPYDDPDFPVLYYSFDKHSAAEFTKLKRQLKQLVKERDKAIDRASSVEQERDGAIARASGTRQEIEQLKQNLNKLNDYKQSADSQIEELKNKIDTLVNEQQKLKEQKEAALNKVHKLQQELEKVTSERDQQQRNHKSHKQRADKLEQDLQQARIESQGLKQTVEVLKQSFSDTQSQLVQKVDGLATSQRRQTERLETTLAMQQFWQTGEYPELGLGDGLGPQLKKLLIQKLSHEHYDVIIQFGISDCTLFLASAVDKLKSSGRQLTSLQIDRSLSFKNRKEIVTNDTVDYEDPLNNTCLPAEVCVFEHNVSKLHDLELKAKQHQLGSLLSFKHAPLVDYTYQGEDYLHYDSDDAIKQLKELLEGRKAKLLVLVSGPTTSEDQRNRFPALPKVLNAFSKHELHLITDNYYEKGAKEVAVNWSRLFDERGLSVEKQIIADDKPGFAWLINR